MSLSKTIAGTENSCDEQSIVYVNRYSESPDKLKLAKRYLEEIEEWKTKFHDLEGKHMILDRKNIDLESNQRDLKRKNADLERKNTDLANKFRQAQKDLKDTQALLGQAVLDIGRKSPLISLGTSTTASKRARSHSVESPPPAKKLKREDKALETPISRVLRSNSQRRLVAYVGITPESSQASAQSLNDEPILRSGMGNGVIETSTGHSKNRRANAGDGLTNAINASPSSQTSPRPVFHPTSPAANNPKLAQIFGKPKAKAQDFFSSSQSVTDMYLQNAKALTISPPALTIDFPRSFLSDVYGGNDQQFLHYIHSNMNPSGPVLRRIVFPMLNLNPSMSSGPGLPGLVFASRHELLSNPPWTVFCKRTSGKDAWLYLGEYVYTLVGKLTAEQFRDQSSVAQRRWADLIIKQNKYDVYVEMRARIVLRRDSMIPHIDKIKEGELIRKEIQAIENGQGRIVTEDEIISAFSNGEEGVDIIRMDCVRYDHAFANDLEARFANYGNLLSTAVKKREDETVAESSTRRRGAPDNEKPKVSVESDSEVDTKTEDVDEQMLEDVGAKNNHHNKTAVAAPAGNGGILPDKTIIRPTAPIREFLASMDKFAPDGLRDMAKLATNKHPETNVGLFDAVSTLTWAEPSKHSTAISIAKFWTQFGVSTEWQAAASSMRLYRKSHRANIMRSSFQICRWQEDSIEEALARHIPGTLNVDGSASWIDQLVADVYTEFGEKASRLVSFDAMKYIPELKGALPYKTKAPRRFSNRVRLTTFVRKAVEAAICQWLSFPANLKFTFAYKALKILTQNGEANAHLFYLDIVWKLFNRPYKVLGYGNWTRTIERNDVAWVIEELRRQFEDKSCAALRLKGEDMPLS